MGLRLSLETESQKREHLEQELRAIKSEASRKSLNGNLQKQSDELLILRQRLDDELKDRERLEEEIRSLKEQVSLLSDEGDEVLLFNGSQKALAFVRISPLYVYYISLLQ
jgi:kinesin family protein 5